MVPAEGFEPPTNGLQSGSGHLTTPIHPKRLNHLVV